MNLTNEFPVSRAFISMVSNVRNGFFIVFICMYFLLYFYTAQRFLHGIFEVSVRLCSFRNTNRRGKTRRKNNNKSFKNVYFSRTMKLILKEIEISIFPN